MSWQTKEFDFMGSWLTYEVLVNGVELAEHHEGDEYRRALRVELEEGDLYFVHVDTRGMAKEVVGDATDVFYAVEFEYELTDVLRSTDTILSYGFSRRDAIIFEDTGTIFVSDRDSVRYV